MKVKNIVFSGFAAAVLMGVAADASAATHVVTKGYIDDLDNTVSVDAGKYVTGVTQTDGKVVSVAETGFDTEIPATNPSETTAPTTKAVYDFVTANDTTYTAGDYIDIDENNAIAVDDVTNVGTDINAEDTGLTTGKAVSEYVTTAVNGITYSGDTYISVDNGTNEIGLTNITSAASGIDTNDTGLTTGKAVYDFVTANDDDTRYTAGDHITIDTANGNAIAVNDVTSAGADIGAGDTGLTTGNAVFEYVANNDDDTTYTAGDYITITGENNSIAVNNVTNDADGIVADNTALTTANAVFQYVDELTGGVLPQGCENGNCALVKLGGNLQWVELTTPLEDGTAN